MLRIEQKSLFTPGAGRRVITISELGKREIQQCYGLEDKAFRVIYMGIDADHYSPEAARAERRATRSRAGVAEDDVIILFAGRDYWRKGLDFLISGVAALPEALCSRTQLWVIGRGKTAKYEKLAGRCSLGERLRFFENIPDTRVIYGAADVFAMPSTYEGFGRTYLEASACGLPVVLGRRHVGAAEIYTDGKDASVIDAISEPSEVAAALEPLFEREVREAMGAAGRELALQYPLSRNIDETESCLEDIKEGRW